MALPSGDTTNVQTVLKSHTVTPLDAGRKRGPALRRRFQKGCFRLESGRAYSYFYEDDKRSDGTLVTRKVRHLIGSVPADLSERAARREHARLMQAVNLKRGSVAPAIRGTSFREAVETWRRDIFPHLSPATVRQRESYLKKHILPRFGNSAIHTIDLSALQQFATEKRKVLSRKTVELIVGVVLGALGYAKKRGLEVANVSYGDIELGEGETTEAPTFKRSQVTQILADSKEPYRTLAILAWATGMRAGEILALTTADLNFDERTIRVSKTADDYTRKIRGPKTKRSVAVLPMPSALAETLRSYLDHHWKPNADGWLFPNPKGTRPRARNNVVMTWLKPTLKRLGIPSKGVGLHAFRHGLATELANASVPLPVLQNQMRHADVRTTLRIYCRVVPESQREAMEKIGQSISTFVPISTPPSA